MTTLNEMSRYMNMNICKVKQRKMYKMRSVCEITKKQRKMCNIEQLSSVKNQYSENLYKNANTCAMASSRSSWSDKVLLLCQDTTTENWEICAFMINRWLIVYFPKLMCNISRTICLWTVYVMLYKDAFPVENMTTFHWVFLIETAVATLACVFGITQKFKQTPLWRIMRDKKLEPSVGSALSHVIATKQGIGWTPFLESLEDDGYRKKKERLSLLFTFLLFTAEVRPPSPTGLRVLQPSAGHLQITWTPVPGAD